MNERQKQIVESLKLERDAYIQRVAKSLPNDAIRMTQALVLRTFNEQIERYEASCK